MRVLIDYRPALRQRSGVGEYTHELSRALLSLQDATGRPRPVSLTLFSSSWKDRFTPDGDLAGASIVDRRVPVQLLNFAWHRLEWPPAELLAAAAFDVVHSLHPLLLPARRAAQVVTIHDLNFLSHPERTRAEIRRDYGRLARQHARRADRIIAVSAFTAGEIEKQLEVARERISVCSPGAPPWSARTGAPDGGGYILFFGTLEPRKNVGGLLDAYERLVARRRDLPELVLAGQATAAAAPWLARITRAPLAGRVRHIGYVEPTNRRVVYDGARMLVQPSFEEGFGITVLEAMTRGVPVVAANRGALPEVLGGAGLTVDPAEPDALESAIERMIDDAALAARCSASGVERARHYQWAHTAHHMINAYQQAIDAHRN